MSADAYANAILNLKPLAYWKCDETAGTTITDYGPHGLDGTLAGTLGNTTTGIGQFDSLLDFDGSTNVITIGTALNSLYVTLFSALNSNGVGTVNFWAAWDGFGSGTRDGVIGNMYDANDGDGWGIFFDDLNAVDGLRWQVSGGASSTGVAFTPSVIPDTALYMHTIVLDGTNITLYRNGVSGGSGATPLRVGNMDDSMTIGAIESNGATDWFDGKLGQIAIFQEALTAAQLVELYNLGQNARTVAGNTKISGVAVEHSVTAVDIVTGLAVGSGVADVSGDFSVDVATDGDVFLLEYDDYGSDWVLSTAYSLDDRVHPSTPNGYYYICTTAGTSDTTEPTWPTSGTVADNTAVWTATAYNRPRVHGPIKVV